MPHRRSDVTRFSLGLLLLGAVCLVLSACHLSQEHEVRGRVVGFGDDDRTVIVEHEAIPGLMPAMTMPFTTQASGTLADLEQGDAIAFTLVITRDSSWIHRVRTLPDDAVAEHPAAQASSTTAAPSSASILQEGDRLPPIELTNQDGETIHLRDYEGQALLLTFIYTRCPLPEYCPRLSRHFARLQPRLKNRFGDRVQLLSISFDPEHDTPQVLRAYARRYTEDTEQWTFATGTAEQIGTVTSLFGVFYEASGEQIDHNLTTALIGPGGRVRRLWRGNRWTPDEVVRAATDVLGADEL